MIFFNTLVYILVYITLSLIIVFTIYLVAMPIWKYFFGYYIGERDRKGELHTTIWILPFFIFHSLISFTCPYLLLSNVFDYYPPVLSEQKNVFDEVAADRRLSDLSLKVDKLKNTLDDLDSLTIREVREELSNTLHFLESLRFEAIEHEKIIRQLKKQISVAREEAVEARSMADRIKSITEPQFEAIKTMITQQSKSESSKAFWLGVITSFPIGVTSSLTAAWLFRRFIKVSRKNKNHRTSGLSKTS